MSIMRPERRPGLHDPARQHAPVTTTIDGHTVTLRPIRTTDADMEAEFVRQLSSATKHYRFLGAVKELSAADVKRFCDVDGQHSMAFVATIQQDGHEKQVGVSRYTPDANADVRELAVTIADKWQSTGLAALLMKSLIAAAMEYGVKQLYSIDFADNVEMRKLAAECLMTAQQDPDDAHQVIYSLTLKDSASQQ